MAQTPIPADVLVRQSDWLNEQQIPLGIQDAHLCFLHPGMAEFDEERLGFQRLEFLGDAVLNLAAAQTLLDAFPDAPEGALSIMRTHLVRTEALAERTEALGLGQIVHMRDADRDADGRPLGKIPADLFEALVGAIATAHGFATAIDWVKPDFEPLIEALSDGTTILDAKSQINELAQRLALSLPKYDNVELSDGQFRCTVQLGTYVAEGNGPSKKRAEQAAAENFLRNSAPLLEQNETSS